MINTINNFGRNAGKIWKTLNLNGPLTENILIKKTRLNENDLYAGLGWLARENKICKTGSKYELRETNLTGKIGVDAGKVWNLLYTQGEIDVSAIAEITQITMRDAYSALGWLACEDKIKTTGGRAKNQKIKFGLK